MGAARTGAVGTAASIATVLLLAAPLPAGAAPPPAGACTTPEQPSPIITEQPWAQRMLGPQRVWPRSTGAGVLVAVVDSGVDDDHPQLAAPGKVRPGKDFYLVGDRPGNFDCASHGTATASIIAGSPVSGVGFAGVAPGAAILPVRVVERAVDDAGGRQGIDYRLLADGIRYAADSGAQVINLSLSGRTDDPQVRAAIAYARGKDALLVASAGNMGQHDVPGAPTFPAAYDGVLGVGAVDMAGELLGDSQTGPQVDLVAPGGSVAGAARVRGHQYWKGTSAAAPFVAGTAALVRAARPELSADEAAARILATVTPAPGGRGSTSYGAGAVDPYRAVTDELTHASPAAAPPVTRAPVDPRQQRLAAWWSGAERGGKLIAALGGGAALLGVIFLVVLVRGHRSGWRARRSRPVSGERTIERLPDELFLLPPPPSER